MSKEVNFFPIHYLEANEPSHVIECQVCQNAFDPEILTRSVQSLLKLAGAAKYQLDQGVSPSYLKLQLVSGGLKESFADNLISLASY